MVTMINPPADINASNPSSLLLGSCLALTRPLADSLARHLARFRSHQH